MKFKIGDVVKDTTEKEYILYEVVDCPYLGFTYTHEEGKNFWVKVYSLPPNYDGYFKVGSVYSDYESRYKLINRKQKAKGYQPPWL